MDLPEALRRRLEDFSRTVLLDQRGTRSSTRENDAFVPQDKRVLSSLHLQMSLYFNMWFFPLWWISETVMLHLKETTGVFSVRKRRRVFCPPLMFEFSREHCTRWTCRRRSEDVWKTFLGPCCWTSERE